MPYKNKKDLYDYINNLRKENKSKVRNYLKKHPCIDCGENNWIVLDFDHVRGKKKIEISKMCNNKSYCWNTILEEIKKCEVRCANCHRIKTWKSKHALEAQLDEQECSKLTVAGSIPV